MSNRDSDKNLDKTRAGSGLGKKKGMEKKQEGESLKTYAGPYISV